MKSEGVTNFHLWGRIFEEISRFLCAIWFLLLKFLLVVWKKFLVKVRLRNKIKKHKKGIPHKTAATEEGAKQPSFWIFVFSSHSFFVGSLGKNVVKVPLRKGNL